MILYQMIKDYHDYIYIYIFRSFYIFYELFQIILL